MVLVDVIKKREGRNSLSLFLKKIKKILKKTIDKWAGLWYNKDTVKERKEVESYEEGSKQCVSSSVVRGYVVRCKLHRTQLHKKGLCSNQ
jgi:hypothetical protein